MMAEEVYLFSVGLFSLVLFVQCGIDGIEPTSWTTSSTSYCYDGEVRLENSTYLYDGRRSSYGGRVEVCYSGAFYPVCDDGWTYNEATVVCKYFGYGLPYYRAVATGGGEFGLSDNAPIFQNLMCNGSEYTFSDCRGYAPNNIVGDYCSSGNHQAGVYCIEACSYGEVYFENATYGYTNDKYWYGGRVAVCYNDTYYPVCDEGWTEQDSAVVCSNVYYRAPYYRAQTSLPGEFGLSYKTPILQQPMCSGSEYSLKDCQGYDPNNIAGDYCLSGSNQVGVMCIEACYDGQIRFGDSISSYDNDTYSYGGRVEVCSGDVYHPVCDEGWTDNDATVVCRYIGYGPPYYRAETAVNGEFGFSNETLILQTPMCNGSEYQLSACEGFALDNVMGNYCLSESHQVGVVCIEACYDGQIRFENTNYSYVNGLYSYGGRVEVCSGDVYHPVCDEGWTENDATVVCRYIGYGAPYYRAETAVNGEFGFSNEAPILQTPMCNGSEYQLGACEGFDLNNVMGDYCLSESHQVGVVCIEVPTSTTPCKDGDTRLEDATYNYTDRGYMYGGRVEVCYNGDYYPVCDEGWTQRDALVVCNNVGYYGYTAELSFPREFGQSDTGPILQNPMCSGSEYYLCDCPGFALNNVAGDYCLSGEHQVGVWCIEGERQKFFGISYSCAIKQSKV
ncbi:Deleted in malignant brain tumors 1 protein [Geodia barretti]|uniref:Deleted in malignant brain tumors 1 protein n=1 Tax=Geodia barretti TaxID=519541 RepID=A0AA35QTI6_GEOBA|nr:Deleted in malignant brain tumors 1 protein [Geodia barretti]